MTRRVLGITLVVLGIIGLFLPILQGIVLIIAGLMVLGVIHKKIHRHHHEKSRTLQKRKK